MVSMGYSFFNDCIHGTFKYTICWYASPRGVERFSVLMTAILSGWVLSRAQYSRKNYQGLFKLIILGTIPPLLWGLYQYLIIHTKHDLQLHSVGHVNHSAIYLVMIFGASLGWFLSHLNLNKFKLKFSNFFVFSLYLLIYYCL